MRQYNLKTNNFNRENAEMRKYIDGVMDAAKETTSDWIVVRNPLAEDELSNSSEAFTNKYN